MDGSPDGTAGFGTRMRHILALVPPPPRAWIVFLLIATMLSTLEVRFGAGLESLTFRVTAITATLIGLVWLPVIVKVYALVGGSVKTPVGEASSPGLLELVKLLPEDAQRPALASFAATADVAATTVTGPQRERALTVSREIEKELSTLPRPSSIENVKQRLVDLAEQYEFLRRTLPSGGERMLKLSAVVREAGSLVDQGAVTHELMTGWMEDFANAGDGQRLIGLALIRGLRDPRTFPAVSYELTLGAIKHPRSPFEQYQALRIAEVMVRHRALNDEERGRLAEALKYQRSTQDGAIIAPDDPSRWDLSGSILSQLESMASGPRQERFR
jgi:hypothetical protein